ncbi:MAG: efflux transporter outer membrane subunit [Burkholderiales bacterium]
MSRRQWMAIVAMAGIVSGCGSMRPEFKAPALDVPDGFREAAAALPPEERGAWKKGEPAEAAARGEWWKAFGDPVLEGLIVDGTRNNPGLQAAAARVRQARAILGITEADRGVQLSAGAGPISTRPSPASLGLPPGADAPARSLWRGTAVASYEVDLFGRLKDQSAAARSDAEGAEATLRSVVLALQADVARTYFELREADADRRLLLEALRIRESNLTLLQRRFDAGAIGEFDVTRAKGDLAATRSDLHAADARRARLDHALAVLVGRPPTRLSLEAGGKAWEVPSVPAGLPSALLERRPDIVAAQRALVAANARIGVAKAAFFPSLRLTGNAGFESDALGDLFRWSSRTWFLGPFIGGLVSVPILDGGRNKAGLERARAAYEEAVGEYRQRVLVAFGDVEDGLSGLRGLAGQAEAAREAITAARRAAQLARIRYDAGAVTYLEVLEAERFALEAERAGNRVDAARALGTVSLIRSLGGGWGPVVGTAAAPGAASGTTASPVGK